MRQEKVKWIFIFLLSIGFAGIHAQTSLNVKEKSDKHTSFVLSDIKTVIFTSGIMTVNKRDGGRTDFAMIEVRNLNFGSITSLDKITTTSDQLLMLYPNPVYDKLKVQYESEFEENVFIQIFDIQGKIVYQQNQKSHSGTNNTDIPVGTFQKGIYLFRLQNDNKIELNKFIKE